MKNDIQVSLKISAELLDKIDTLAKENESTRSQIIRLAIKNYIKEIFND